MPDTQFNFDPDDVVEHCHPTPAGEQALQRVRMEHQYGKGPFVGRADHDATVPESLHYVDVFWDEWGREYLTMVLSRFAVRDPEGVTATLDRMRTTDPEPIAIRTVPSNE